MAKESQAELIYSSWHVIFGIGLTRKVVLLTGEIGTDLKVGNLFIYIVLKGYSDHTN